jgi:hypothetical protein
VPDAPGSDDVGPDVLASGLASGFDPAAAGALTAALRGTDPAFGVDFTAGVRLGAAALEAVAPAAFALGVVAPAAFALGVVAPAAFAFGVLGAGFAVAVAVALAFAFGASAGASGVAGSAAWAAFSRAAVASGYGSIGSG